MPFPLLTIGYSVYAPEAFLAVLKEHDAGAVVDVRAWPCSTHFPRYNAPELQPWLKARGIYYLSFGEEFGARPRDPALFSQGRADFAKIAASAPFQEGCRRLRQGLEKFPVCLMCAQKDPANCHRSILITHRFRKANPDIPILHLQPERTETQQELDQRLMTMSGHDQADLFRSRTRQLEDAYAARERVIAWTPTAGKEEE